MRTALLLLTGLSGLLIACNDSRPANADAGGIVLDASAPRDAGRDGGGSDSGMDPCVATMGEAALTVACNGGVYGRTQRDNEIDGSCMPEASVGPGSCFTPAGGATPFCVEVNGDDVCIFECAASGYVSTGGCPIGSRCFEVDDGIGECFRDCFGNADCFSGEECDAEGSCVPR